ncbi:TPA: hypothetical protein G8O67_005059 [Salmonella enterica]|uniref:Uncharacterized protein n=1 Tax=Salmonella enterica TaxID=28901 RepID=A0A756I533_SALER|nr:hypothetical protein [Salmonella enterica]
MTGITIDSGRMTVRDGEGRVRLVAGDTGNTATVDRKPPAPLTAEEEIYGRGLYSLPEGWEDLSGDGRWLHYLSDELRNMWPQLPREQKMAIASSMGEMASDMFDLACSIREGRA